MKKTEKEMIAALLDYAKNAKLSVNVSIGEGNLCLKPTTTLEEGLESFYKAKKSFYNKNRYEQKFVLRVIDVSNLPLQEPFLKCVVEHGVLSSGDEMFIFNPDKEESCKYVCDLVKVAHNPALPVNTGDVVSVYIKDADCAEIAVGEILSSIE